MTENLLHIEGLRVAVEGREIIRDLDLSINKGEVHAIMGPNGSGKSTLAYVLTGRPGYVVTAGKASYKGEDILDLSPDERAKIGDRHSEIPAPANTLEVTRGRRLQGFGHQLRVSVSGDIDAAQAAARALSAF